MLEAHDPELASLPFRATVVFYSGVDSLLSLFCYIYLPCKHRLAAIEDIRHSIKDGGYNIIICIGPILTSIAESGESECQLQSSEEKNLSSETNGKELENGTHTTVTVQQT